MLRTLSIRRKLIAMSMAVALLALAAASVAFLVVAQRSFRGELLQDLSTHASVVGANNTAALLFDDANDATTNLVSLSVDPHILAARIYKPDGSAFATFRRNEAVALPDRRPAT